MNTFCSNEFLHIYQVDGAFICIQTANATPPHESDLFPSPKGIEEGTVHYASLRIGDQVRDAWKVTILETEELTETPYVNRVRDVDLVGQREGLLLPRYDNRLWETALE